MPAARRRPRGSRPSRCRRRRRAPGFYAEHVFESVDDADEDPGLDDAVASPDQVVVGHRRAEAVRDDRDAWRPFARSHCAAEREALVGIGERRQVVAELGGARAAPASGPTTWRSRPRRAAGVARRTDRSQEPSRGRGR